MGENIEIDFIQKLTAEILMNSLLDNLYICYTIKKILKGRILTITS